MARVKSFSEITYYDFNDQLAKRIKSDIESKGKEYILGIDEEEYKSALISQYTLDPLSVDFNSASMGEPVSSKEWVENSHFGERYQRDTYTFTINYSFSGSPMVFRIRPSSWIMSSTEITINEDARTVSFSFKIYEKKPEIFEQTKSDFLSRAFGNVNSANADIQTWNSQVPGLVNTYFQNQKIKYQEENNFFAAINVKVNPDTNSVFTAPTIKKKIIPQPILDKKKEFASEPMMATEMYNGVLKVIYEAGKAMERKPALYQNKDEEGLRDQFLFIMETRYEGVSATGETFNKGGKTDILLKYVNDGSNLFVAECKFWHGESEFMKAISQLFDRYLTWRDSKTALIMFIQNKDFTNVLNTIKTEIKKHPCYVKENGTRGESSFSYIFRLPQDKDKMVFFEVMAFHYDK